MLEGSDLLIEQKGYLFSSVFYFSWGGSAYSTYAFGRGLPQKHTKAYKGGRGVEGVQNCRIPGVRTF